MATHTCPSCGHSWIPTPRSRSRALAAAHPGPDASEAAIKAHYHATAPREDIRFTLARVERLQPVTSRMAARVEMMWARYRQYLADDGPTPTAAIAASCAQSWRELTIDPTPNEDAMWAAHRDRIERLRQAVTPEMFAALKGGGCWPPMGSRLGPVVAAAVYGRAS